MSKFIIDTEKKQIIQPEDAEVKKDEIEKITIDTEKGINKQEKLEPLPVYSENHKLLDEKIPEYKEGFPNPSMVKLAERLKITMKMYAALGLSANQCGVPERIFVIGTEYFQLVCINPEVISMGDEKVKEREGCLSFPGLFLNLDRPKSIEVAFNDEHGNRKGMKIEGLTARSFLHELDHLNGVKFTSYVKPLALKMARDRQDKIIRQAVRRQKKSESRIWTPGDR